VTDPAGHWSFYGATTSGPFTPVEGLFTVLMCADCQRRGSRSGAARNSMGAGQVARLAGRARQSRIACSSKMR
jgi:hypothetical protein